MRILPVSEHDGRLVVVAHMDESKLLDDGTPDPEWCRAWEWSKDGMTQAQIVAETTLLAQSEMAGHQASGITPLAATPTKRGPKVGMPPAWALPGVAALLIEAVTKAF